MILDLHSHTVVSWCGKDDPEQLVLEMISKGVQALGVCDHNYGVGDDKRAYFEMLDRLKRKYAQKIKIIRGIEVATIAPYNLGDNEDVSYFDYCLVEHLDVETSVIKGDIVSFAKRLGARTGIAHTDLFAFAKKRPEGVKKYLESLVNAGVFWELNVNYDSIHGYREHSYVKRFFASVEEQNLVKEVGLTISVGFDGHRMEDYDVSRVKSACEFLENGKFNFIGNHYKEI